MSIFFKKIALYFVSMCFLILFPSEISYARSRTFRFAPITFEYAANLAKNTSLLFSIEMNDAILKELNYLLNTAIGQKFVRESLQRMKQYQNIFEETLAKYNCPNEFLAIAFLESSFSNPKGKAKTKKPAGMWQLTPPTARLFKLKVDEKKDERLDIQKSTDAALKHLTQMTNRLGDPKLAILAYNIGEKKVQTGVRKLKTKNPWKLAENGYRGHNNYLARVIAAAIVLNNSHLISS